MKTKYLLMAAIMLLGTLSFTACGDDDEEINLDDIIEKIEKGELKAKVTITGNNPLLLTAVWAGYATEVHTATFGKEDFLQSYIITMTYANEQLALQEWKDIVEDAEDEPEILTHYKRNGKVITQDATQYILEEIRDAVEDGAEMTDKEIVENFFYMIKKQYEKGNRHY